MEVPSCLFDITRCVCEWVIVFGDYYGVWILGSWVCKKCSPFPLWEALDVSCVTEECVFVTSGVGDFLFLGRFFCGHEIFFVSGLMFLSFCCFLCLSGIDGEPGCTISFFNFRVFIKE